MLLVNLQIYIIFYIFKHNNIILLLSYYVSYKYNLFNHTHILIDSLIRNHVEVYQNKYTLNRNVVDTLSKPVFNILNSYNSELQL